MGWSLSAEAPRARASATASAEELGGRCRAAGSSGIGIHVEDEGLAGPQGRARRALRARRGSARPLAATTVVRRGRPKPTSSPDSRSAAKRAESSARHSASSGAQVLDDAHELDPEID